ncbi:hypothetical protein SVIOM74S_03400 [Streptomyces violarus]
MVLARPCVVTDYSASRQISHEYDAPVAVEGLRSVLAVPVVVRHSVRGVLYGALRTALPLGGRMLDEAVEAARDVERALVVREEARSLAAGGGAGVGREQVRRRTRRCGHWPRRSPILSCGPSCSTRAPC